VYQDRYQTMTEVVAALESLPAPSTVNSEDATAWVPTVEERKKLSKAGAPKPLAPLVQVVASEKSKHLFATIIGGAFATIIAPILVTLVINYLEKDESKSKPSGANVPPEAASKVVPLFDGKTLNGWHGDNALWSVQDGAIVGSCKSPLRATSFLVTDKMYHNFRLRLKVHLIEGNSGVQIRSVEKQKWLVAGPQADIAYGDFKWLGCLTGEGIKPAMIARTSDDTKQVLRRIVNQATWNDMTVTVNGQSVSIQLNGHTTVDVVSSSIPNEAGVIALQLLKGHATTIRFKDITLEPLP
jgi:hypothetical protein